MKLIFDENTNIRKILGFTDANLDFEDLRPTIIPATDELVKLISKPLYDSLVGIFESDSASDTDLEFLERAQYAVLLDAYKNYSSENDLGHTTNGRVNRIEDNQKIAFEWQIDRSNRSIERKYYKALDGLIYFMDADVSGWKNTDSYKSTRELFVRTTREFDEIFNIDGSRLLMIKLATGIKKAEREDILPRIGTQRYSELKASLVAGTPVDAVLLSFIQEAIVFKALSWGITRLSAQLFPEGLLQVADTSRLTTAARTNVLKNEAAAMAIAFQDDAKHAFGEIEKYLKSQELPTRIPEPYKPQFNINDGFVDT